MPAHFGEFMFCGDWSHAAGHTAVLLFLGYLNFVFGDREDERRTKVRFPYVDGTQASLMAGAKASTPVISG